MTSIDLHVHSAYSDGVLTPAALCTLALRKQIRVIALCDHDTTDGLAPMQAAVDSANEGGQKITLLPSLELSAGAEGRTHILGYGADPQNDTLQAVLHNVRAHRQERGKEMLAALAKLGISIPPEWLPADDDAGMACGRPHIARGLIRLGVVNTMEQAFDQYLTPGKPAYVPLKHLTAAEAVALLKQTGAVPVLAHPVRMQLPPNLLEALVKSLQADGLRGIEVFHPSASRRDIRWLQGIAERRSLLVTGGSDFHGDHGTRVKLGGLPSGWNTWQSDLQALTDAMRASSRRQE